MTYRVTHIQTDLLDFIGPVDRQTDLVDFPRSVLWDDRQTDSQTDGQT